MTCILPIFLWFASGIIIVTIDWTRTFDLKVSDIFFILLGSCMGPFALVMLAVNVSDDSKSRILIRRRK